MRPTFYTRLVNGPFGDPCLFMAFLLEKRAIMFDLGEINSLSSRDILKVSHVFVTHTHIDHFAGFDRLLRILLGREKKIYIYGPFEFLKNIEGKLASYTWNLVGNYESELVFIATEINNNLLITKEYSSRYKFIPQSDAIVKEFNGILVDEESLTVHTAILDHLIPCLGFSIKEKMHVNIKKNKLEELGLKTGPWLKKFKEALVNPKIDISFDYIDVPLENGNIINFNIAELADKIATSSKGQKISYISDVIYNSSNFEKIIQLIFDSDVLYIESHFLENENIIAHEKFHLTAKQAGTIAKLSKSKEFHIFHFSPRYMHQRHLLEQEAMQAYQNK
ncbi:MAG: MBL fold metallo-hydrolase [Desulfobacterales bacterium]|nr:MBL fold metallo-hydrolase [Desulfobacterales bacterium]